MRTVRTILSFFQINTSPPSKPPAASSSSPATTAAANAALSTSSDQHDTNGGSGNNELTDVINVEGVNAVSVVMPSSSLEELDTCKLGRLVCAARLSLMGMCSEFFEKALPYLVLKYGSYRTTK